MEKTDLHLLVYIQASLDSSSLGPASEIILIPPVALFAALVTAQPGHKVTRLSNVF